MSKKYSISVFFQTINLTSENYISVCGEPPGAPPANSILGLHTDHHNSSFYLSFKMEEWAKILLIGWFFVVHMTGTVNVFHLATSVLAFNLPGVEFGCEV